MRGSGEFAGGHYEPNFEGAVDVDRDRALVERCQAGDLEAFNTLYLHYHQRLLRFCAKRLQERSESEDIVQETFARAWRGLPTFAGDRRFYPWLTVIAGNLCTDVLRRRARLTSLDETTAQAGDAGHYDIEDAVLQDVDSKMVATAFENLKPRHQRVLDLRERSGWSYQRIADQEGVGVSAVETLLWRARNALKREFALLAGAEGKAGALIAVTMALPKNAIRRLSMSFRNHVPSWFRHVVETGRHLASGVTPAGASVAAAGAVVVGLGAVYLSPGTSAIATSTGGPPTTSTVAPSVGAAGSGTPPPTVPALTPGVGAGAPVAPSAPSPTTTSGSGTGTPGTSPATGSQPDPASGLSQPISGVGGALGGAGAGAGGAVGGLTNGVGGAVDGVGGVVGGVGSTGTSGSGLGQGINGAAGAAGGAVSGAGSGLGQAITGITGGVSTLLGGSTG